jgi:hypothetical protein
VGGGVVVAHGGGGSVLVVVVVVLAGRVVVVVVVVVAPGALVVEVVVVVAGTHGRVSTGVVLTVVVVVVVVGDCVVVVAGSVVVVSGAVVVVVVVVGEGSVLGGVPATARSPMSSSCATTTIVPSTARAVDEVRRGVDIARSRRAPSRSPTARQVIGRSALRVDHYRWPRDCRRAWPLPRLADLRLGTPASVPAV